MVAIIRKVKKKYVFRHKLALFRGSGLKIRLNLRGGISLKTPKVDIISYKVALFFFTAIEDYA